MPRPKKTAPATVTPEPVSADTEIEDLRAQIATLEAKLEAAQAAIPVAPRRRVLGSIRSDGLVVLLGTHTADTLWKTAQTSASQVAIDFSGPRAEYLADRVRRHAVSCEELPDRTWRIVMANAQHALSVQGEAQRYLKTQDDVSTSIAVNPLKTTALQALDATRAEGYGIVTINGQPAIAALRGSDVMPVYVEEDEDGRPLGLYIAPS